MKLFMVLLGCKPKDRKIEQHDIFFGISNTLKELVPEIVESWSGAGKIHIDAWREVNVVDGHEIQIVPKRLTVENPENEVKKLFFVNLGGYKQNELEEFHYKMLLLCKNKTTAIQRAKSSAFYRHTGFKNASSHIDDKYGVDVDDIYEIDDILPLRTKAKYNIQTVPSATTTEDQLHLGYFVLDRL